MRPVGVAGLKGVGAAHRKSHHRVGGNDRAKAAAYRTSPEGRLARKMYLMQPEVKAKMAERRRIKRHLGKVG